MPTVSPTQKAITTAIANGSTKNFIDVDEARAIVAATKHSKPEVNRIENLLNKALVGYGETDSFTAHAGPVMTQKAYDVLSREVWQHGADHTAGDFHSMEAAALKKGLANGNVATLKKGSAAAQAREAKDLLDGDYFVRMSGIDAFSVKKSELPAAARDVVTNPNAEYFRFLAAGHVTYAVAVHNNGSDTNSAWIFDEAGKQIGFTRPEGGGSPD